MSYPNILETILSIQTDQISLCQGGGVFGSIVCVGVVVVICVIPCEHFEAFRILLEPCFDHIKVSDESSKTGDLDLDLQGQIGLETSRIMVLIFFKFKCLEFYLQT